MIPGDLPGPDTRFAIDIQLINVNYDHHIVVWEIRDHNFYSWSVEAY